MSQVQNILILEVKTVQFMSIFSDFGHFLPKNFGFGYHGNGRKIRELSINDFVLGENNQVQKVSLKSETMRVKLCSIFTENRS